MHPFLTPPLLHVGNLGVIVSESVGTGTFYWINPSRPVLNVWKQQQHHALKCY